MLPVVPVVLDVLPSLPAKREEPEEKRESDAGRPWPERPDEVIGREPPSELEERPAPEDVPVEAREEAPDKAPGDVPDGIPDDIPGDTLAEDEKRGRASSLLSREEGRAPTLPELVPAGFVALGIA